MTTLSERDIRRNMRAVARAIGAAFNMSRYSTGDPYLDPASGVLRNRLSIADEIILKRTAARYLGAKATAGRSGNASVIWRNYIAWENIAQAEMLG